MERYKNKVKYWMIFNEINNQNNYKYPLFGYTCSGVIFENEEHPEECMYQVVHKVKIKLRIIFQIEKLSVIFYLFLAKYCKF